jgi:hypothetical protein
VRKKRPRGFNKRPRGVQASPLNPLSVAPCARPQSPKPWQLRAAAIVSPPNVLVEQKPQSFVVSPAALVSHSQYVAQLIGTPARVPPSQVPWMIPQNTPLCATLRANSADSATTRPSIRRPLTSVPSSLQQTPGGAARLVSFGVNANETDQCMVSGRSSVDCCELINISSRTALFTLHV